MHSVLEIILNGFGTIDHLPKMKRVAFVDIPKAFGAGFKSLSMRAMCPRYKI